MILPDVNILVHAFHVDADEHLAYVTWLQAVREGTDLLLPDLVLAGFLRIVTNSRIYAPPAPMPEALSFVEALLRSRRVRQVEDSGKIWQRFHAITDLDNQVRGNFVTDAYLASCALSHGARLATRDRGFARYPGLRWFDPAKELAGQA